MNPLLYAAFLDRYPRAEYAFMEEVCEDVIGGKRRADAMVLNFWSSRGRELQGFEVKSYRGDWLREKKDPSKAEALARYCDRWWIVDDSEEDIVKKEELPPTWGLLVRRGKKLVQVVAASKLTPTDRPWSFVCSLVRRAQDHTAALERQAVLGAKDEARAELIAKHTEAIQGLHQRIEAEKKRFEEIEEKLGVKINRWACTPEQLGAAVEFIRMGGAEGLERQVLQRLRSFESGAQAIVELLAPFLVEAKASAPAIQDLTGGQL